MSREDLHFRLRIPESLKNLVKDAAESNRRSMTAEIVERLEKSFEDTFYDLKLRQHETLESQNKTMEVQSQALRTQAKAIEHLQKIISDTISIDDWALKYGFNSRDEAVRRLAEIALIFDERIPDLMNGWEGAGDRAIDVFVKTMQAIADPNEDRLTTLDSVQAGSRSFTEHWQNVGYQLAYIADAADVLKQKGQFDDLVEKAHRDLRHNLLALEKRNNRNKQTEENL